MKRAKLLCVLVFIFTLLFATTAYNACDEVVFLQNSTLLKEIPPDKPPTNTENQICLVKSTTSACIIEKKYYEAYQLLFLKLEILDGDCAGKVGWANSSYTKKK